ncbi:MAG: 3-phosphoshikimate 1-carboxyvinyltransferase [Candidatus Omnitrophica bacterium]|nr:3-phosphoshikimate 1-carboxyvinyltransferase [Candidatus Omnitrophota bacterium]
MYKIRPLNKVKRQIVVPADKSISHRAAIISSISKGKTHIKPYLVSEDTQATLDCLKICGVRVNLNKEGLLTVEGVGLYLSRKKRVTLSAGESGTTLRILSGLLCAQKFSTRFNSANSLEKRPMERITVPLRLMGADIKGKCVESEEYPPLLINPAKLKGIKYKLPIPSAQVKSALLLASLYAKGETQIIEPAASRDHTERMLSLFKAKLKRQGKSIISSRVKMLISPNELFIPSDFSSASFFIVLGLILKNSEILIKNVNINPTRCGLLRVLIRMGAKIEIINKKDYYEPYTDILVKSSSLRATEVEKKEIPSMIDEIPILAVAASFAKGKTRLKGVGELKVKETDRINSLRYNLTKVGVEICAYKYKKQGREDWALEIKGNPCFYKKGRVEFRSFSDHRTAMSLIILAAAGERESKIDEIQCINKSFPEFIPLIESL